MDTVEEQRQANAPEKLEMTFTGRGLHALYEIARRENLPLDEVVESALGLKEWTLDVRDAGDEIIVRDGKKDKYKLVP